MFNLRILSDRLALTLSSIALLGLSACATASYDSAQTPGMSDPIENVNRTIFAFNNQFDTYILNPTIEGYRTVVPSPARTGLDNALTNLQKPISFTNSLLQGDIDNALDTGFTFIVNTLVGFGGLIDIAGYEGYTSNTEDFGQTLGVWGVSDGAYLIVPFIGSTTVRDGVGYGVDSLLDPVNWYSHNVDEPHIQYNKFAINYFNTRNNLKDLLVELEKSSIDYYASVRSTYYQHRQASIRNGEASETTMEFPEYDDY